MLIARGTPVWIISIPVMPAISIVLFYITDLAILIPVSVTLLIACIPLLLFFRDPDRPIGKGVVSPADGKVTRVRTVGEWTEISIFMNVHNVHVNRMPWKGKILSVEHRPGTHIPAFDKDSDRNERVRIRIGTDYGDWEMTQIAGAVARRIVPYVSEGFVLEKGERIGMIRFGSRVDLRFRQPSGHMLWVKEGDRVIAGKTSLSE